MPETIQDGKIRRYEVEEVHNPPEGMRRKTRGAYKSRRSKLATRGGMLETILRAEAEERGENSRGEQERGTEIRGEEKKENEDVTKPRKSKNLSQCFGNKAVCLSLGLHKG